MKWHKFRDVRKQAPWILWHVGSLKVVSAPLNYQRGEATRLLRNWVRHRIGYIAFRPFSSLNLNEGNSSTGTSEHWTDVGYSIRLHIGDVDQPFERLRYVLSHIEEEGQDETSIRKVMLELQAWHQKYWEKRGRPLNLDAVVKVITSGKRDRGSAIQNVEVFPIPPGFTV